MSVHELECAMLKVASEAVSDDLRGRVKIIEKELATLEKALSVLAKKPDTTPQSLIGSVGKLESRMNELKQKLMQSHQAMQLGSIKTMQGRLDWLRSAVETGVAADIPSSGGQQQPPQPSEPQPQRDVAGLAKAPPFSYGLRHIAPLSSLDAASSERLNRRRTLERQRISRVVVDYLLRKGYHRTAARLAHDETSGIGGLVDLDVFERSKRIVEELRHKNCEPALEWCNENRIKLKRLHSSLEFRLKLQQFIQMVFVCRSAPSSSSASSSLPSALSLSRPATVPAMAPSALDAALEYARVHLLPFADTSSPHHVEVQHAMLLLAFISRPLPLSAASPQQLVHESRWQDLIAQFEADNCAVMSIASSTSVLESVLRAGISALKTPVCGLPEHQNQACPACSPSMAPLVQLLPCARHGISTIVCRITGQIINEDNPAMMLPNGNVYSKKGLESIADCGKVRDPRSPNQVYQLSSARRVFII